MEEARSPIGTCELPTGVLLDGKVEKEMVFRELAGPEEDVLAGSLSGTQKMTLLMAQVTKSFGSVTDREKIKKMVESMVISDRWFYLSRIRILSLGANYEFKSKCPACDTEDKVHYDLNQISVKNPPQAENLYREVVTPSGIEIRWKIATGETEKVIEKLANNTNAVTVAMAARITEVNKSPSSTTAVLALSMKDRSAIRKSFEEHEGDFDDEFDATCPKCSHSYKGELSLDARAFFSL
jgi:hypothetical protein